MSGSKNIPVDTQDTLDAIFKDQYGNPSGAPTNMPTWSADHPELLQAFTPAGDGLSCAIRTGFQTGVVVVTVADTDSHGNAFSDSFTIDIVAGEAEQVQIVPVD